MHEWGETGGGGGGGGGTFGEKQGRDLMSYLQCILTR